MIHRGKRSKTLSEVKPVENISKNLQSFLEIRSVQKEVLLSQRNCQNQLGHLSLSHIEQDCQESLI